MLPPACEGSVADRRVAFDGCKLDLVPILCMQIPGGRVMHPQVTVRGEHVCPSSTQLQQHPSIRTYV